MFFSANILTISEFVDNVARDLFHKIQWHSWALFKYCITGWEKLQLSSVTSMTWVWPGLVLVAILWPHSSFASSRNAFSNYSLYAYHYSRNSASALAADCLIEWFLGPQVRPRCQKDYTVPGTGKAVFLFIVQSIDTNRIVYRLRAVILRCGVYPMHSAVMHATRPVRRRCTKQRWMAGLTAYTYCVNTASTSTPLTTQVTCLSCCHYVSAQ